MNAGTSPSEPGDVDIGAFIQAMLSSTPKPVPASLLLEKISRGVASLPADPAEGAKEAVAEHLSSETNLTRAAARGVFSTALSKLPAEKRTQLTDPAVQKQLAESMAGDISALAGVDVSADLSKPVMLNRCARIGFAAFACAALAAIISIMGVASLRSGVPAGSFVGLGVLGFLFIVALLVLVMGYGQVKIAASVGQGKTGST